VAHGRRVRAHLPLARPCAVASVVLARLSHRPCGYLVDGTGAIPNYSARGAGRMTPNSALLTDTSSLLRYACGAAKRER